MSAPVRLAIVGAGGIGQAYATAVSSLDCVKLCAIADVRPEAGEIAQRVGTRFLTDPLALVAEERPELVVLSTPPASHEDLAVHFLESGVAVMCEKPLARTRAEGHRIVSCAAETGTLLTMASKFRFVTDVIEARNIIASGELGTVVSVEVHFNAPIDMSTRWNSDPAISGGGVLIDNGTHAVDIVRYLLGPIEAVQAMLSSRATGLDVEDTAVLTARTVDGVIASVTVSWSMDRITERYVGVFGTEGSLEVGWNGGRTRLRGAASDVPFGVGYDKFTALGNNVRNVAGAVRGERPLVVTPLDALASVSVIEAAYESARNAAWTSVSSRSQERLIG